VDHPTANDNTKTMQYQTMMMIIIIIIIIIIPVLLLLLLSSRPGLVEVFLKSEVGLLKG